eukprot:7916887-Pyramimonas_sp.AAC.1
MNPTNPACWPRRRQPLPVRRLGTADQKNNPTSPSKNDARTSCLDHGCWGACSAMKGWLRRYIPGRGRMEEESEE